MKKLFLGVLMAGSSFWANAQAQVVVAWYYQEWSITQDSLNYKYNTGTNQLQYITDNVLATVSTTDIDNQNPNNYIYDKSGNMVADNSQSMSVSWSPYGKILQTNKAGGANLQFGYNAMQQRVIKRVSQNGDTTRTYYIRDAQGNTMGVYTRHNDSVTWREQYIFGSSRLGLYKADTLVNKGLQTISKLYEGKRNYELTNHLGNVLAVINDRKTDSLNGSTKIGFNAVVISATDYYPFGMAIDSRSYTSSLYRYGFNGKELDKETGEQDYGERMYDPRLAKFLSIDPYSNHYPELTPYQFASNRPIQGVDLDGLELTDYKVFEKKLFSGESQIKITYMKYDSRDDDMPNNIAKKIHAHVHIDGDWVADLIITAGPLRIDNDGSTAIDGTSIKPKFEGKGVWSAETSTGKNSLTTPFTVYSKDDADKGVMPDDIDILNIPATEDVNSISPKYEFYLDASVGDKGYKIKDGKLTHSHSAVEVSTYIADRMGYRTELLCDNSKKDQGGDNSDKNYSVSVKVVSSKIKNAKNGLITDKTAGGRRFYSLIYSLAQKAIDGENIKGVTVEDYNKTIEKNKKEAAAKKKTETAEKKLPKQTKK